MSKAIKHYGYPGADGRLQADSFRAALNELLSRRVPVVLTVEEYKGKRSNQANRYYWGIVVTLIRDGLKAQGIEATTESTHDLLKFRFLKDDKPIGADGEFVTLVKSTTELDTQAFGEYVEHCKRFAAEYLGVNIPDANEQAALELAA